MLESLEESLKSRTRRFLAAGRPGAAAGAGQLAVDRADIHAGLVEAMGAAGQDTGLLVVHGEPGAGKSAAVLAAVEEIRRAGGAVVALSLRDLPPGPPAATAQLLKAPTATYSASARASLRRAWPAVIIAVLDAVDAGAQGFTDPHWGEYAIAEMIPSPSPVSGDTDPDAIIRAARNGWPTASELNGLIERMLPHAVGYWRAADSLIGLLRTMPLADQANVGLPWVHKIVTNRRVPGMGTWLAVEWLRSLSEANAVDNAVQPLYDALVDTLAAEDYRGAVQL